MPKAVVFAYHNVGVRCLLTLLARGVDVPLVVTHRDNPDEAIWFGSVAEVARAHRIDVIEAEGLAADVLHPLVGALRPDFLFSFYYRNLLPPALLETARRGAYNMHGWRLRKYRGRVPVNWAIIHGETETGATLHEMVAKPDAGASVGQTAVPILPDDTAIEVFHKVTVASEQTLWRVLPALLAGTAPGLPNDLSQGSYFGGRRPGPRTDASTGTRAPRRSMTSCVRSRRPIPARPPRSTAVRPSSNGPAASPIRSHRRPASSPDRSSSRTAPASRSAATDSSSRS